ncbi:uncharacterized protein LOC129312632 [Prosopis cineraria]|uniref:uncharacterized protein LOC129312632 n=1 Tax=Prosopis cineraria TaxID=364024 RepID=UPI00240F992A|nr:uncharacterized protein LOC129312632 [Prosopis cineraria]
MAPKRAERIVVKSARRVVEESTVQVSVVSSTKRSTRANKDAESEEANKDRVRTIPVQTPPDENASDTREDPEQKREREKTQNIAEKPIKEGSEGKGSGNKGVKRKRKKVGRSGEGYRRYVYRVLKQVHPEMGISFQAMTILNNLMTDMFERLADEATRLKTYTGHMTLSSREIQGAVKLVLPGELGRHAIAEGAKAVTNYMSSDAARD